MLLSISCCPMRHFTCVAKIVHLGKVFCHSDVSRRISFLYERNGWSSFEFLKSIQKRSKHFWNLEGGETWSTLCSKKQIHNAEKRWAGTSTRRWQLRHFGWSYLSREGTDVVGKTTPIAVVYLVDYSLISKLVFKLWCFSSVTFSWHIHPLKIDIEAKNHPNEKKHHLPSTFISMLVHVSTITQLHVRFPELHYFLGSRP